jgi:hypothetical protein
MALEGYSLYYTSLTGGSKHKGQIVELALFQSAMRPMREVLLGNPTMNVGFPLSYAFYSLFLSTLKKLLKILSLKLTASEK